MCEKDTPVFREPFQGSPILSYQLEFVKLHTLLVVRRVHDPWNKTCNVTMRIWCYCGWCCWWSLINWWSTRIVMGVEASYSSKQNHNSHSSMKMFLEHIFSGSTTMTMNTTNIFSESKDDNHNNHNNDTSKENSTILSNFLCTHHGSGIPCIDIRNRTQPPVHSILSKLVSPSSLPTMDTLSPTYTTISPSNVPSVYSSTQQPTTNKDGPWQSMAPITMAPITMAPITMEPIDTLSPITMQPNNDDDDPMPSSLPPASQEPDPSSLVPVTTLPTDYESSTSTLSFLSSSSSPITIAPYDSYAPDTSEPQIDSWRPSDLTSVTETDSLPTQPYAGIKNSISAPVSSYATRFGWSWMTPLLVRLGYPFHTVAEYPNILSSILTMTILFVAT
jgi:hypothetical protein